MFDNHKTICEYGRSNGRKTKYIFNWVYVYKRIILGIYMLRLLLTFG